MTTTLPNKSQYDFEWFLLYIAVYHYNDIIMSAVASEITSLTIVYSVVYSGTDQRKHQSSSSLAFVRGIHQWPVNSLHKGPVTRKMLPFDDVIMTGGMLRAHVKMTITFIYWVVIVSTIITTFEFENHLHHCHYHLFTSAADMELIPHWAVRRPFVRHRFFKSNRLRQPFSQNVFAVWPWKLVYRLSGAYKVCKLMFRLLYKSFALDSIETF